jgi:hypothetical protein
MTTKTFFILLGIAFVIGIATGYFAFQKTHSSDNSYKQKVDSLLNDNKVLADSITDINTYILTLEDQNRFLLYDTNRTKTIYSEKINSVIHLPLDGKILFITDRLSRPVGAR